MPKLGCHFLKKKKWHKVGLDNNNNNNRDAYTIPLGGMN